jgi:hypothetical protein
MPVGLKKTTKTFMDIRTMQKLMQKANSSTAI